ncbi:uncharacterized protein LOC119090211 [Pollicipes pollicipes]|uniref:uncharacterized protein LOC119090211 n=1 Tax=Pollicipes pollicipes TaxID=41117 RepID=UPI0018858789|nr:uncharacterized protein LOC119090211 [Pollicipes pollicipes]
MEGMAQKARATGDASQPFMVSALPLVFSSGLPVSLENMLERNLVKFVRFMLKCALGVDETKLRLVRRPAWWPRTVPYFNFKASREVEKGHAERLRELVRCCYRGNACEYLVRFCADLEHHCASGPRRYMSGAPNRLVVTCLNENLEYDRPCPDSAMSPRRHLLPRLARGPGHASKLAMVQPPASDIFLCDSCSAEFSSVADVKAHERECGVTADEESVSDTESVRSEPEVLCRDQTRFLSYVGLVPAVSSGKQLYASPSKQSASAERRQRRRLAPLGRYQAVDLSSPLGRRLGAGVAPPADGLVDYERYCDDGSNKRLWRQPAFPVSWRPPRNGRRIVHRWSHLYSFTAAQRAERRRVIRTGLTCRSRRLLPLVLPCSVPLMRLSPELIAEACQPPAGQG